MTTPIKPMIRRRGVLCRAAALPWLAGLSGIAGAQPGGEATLRMGGFVLAPMVTGSMHELLTGLLRVLLTRDVAPNVSSHFKWLEASSLARVFVGLQDGSIDVLLLRADLPQPLEGAALFSWHTMESQATLAVPMDSKLREIRSLQQLAGLSLGRQLGSPLPAEMEGLPIKWVFPPGQNWQISNLRMTAAGRLDGSVFYNAVSPAYLVKTEGIAVRLLPLPLPPVRFYMWHSLRTDKAAIAEFDRVAGAAFRGPLFRQMLEDALK